LPNPASQSWRAFVRQAGGITIVRGRSDGKPYRNVIVMLSGAMLMRERSALIVSRFCSTVALRQK
jgi:hypothetical protein